MKEFIRSKIRNLITGGEFPLIHAMEPVYQRLVERDLERLGIENDFYPVAGAANYSLLYLLIRAMTDLPVRSVVELGVGESSRLLSRLRSNGTSVTTIEHNDSWAERAKDRVQHEIIKTKLVPKLVQGILINGYDFSPIKGTTPIDLLIVDGPPASTQEAQFARLGAVDLVASLNPKDFVVILDDTHRAGEMVLVDKFAAALRKRGCAFNMGQVITSKRQTIFAGRAFESAAYF